MDAVEHYHWIESIYETLCIARSIIDPITTTECYIMHVPSVWTVDWTRMLPSVQRFLDYQLLLPYPRVQTDCLLPTNEYSYRLATGGALNNKQPAKQWEVHLIHFTALSLHDLKVC